MSLPTPEQTLEGLKTALAYKKIATTNLFEKQIDVANARKKVVEARNAIINEYNDVSKHPDGQKALGSNEAGRAAAIENLITAERAELEVAEGKVTEGNTKAQLAQIDVDLWRYTLRLLEVASK
jgi:hypothetical protein